MEIESNGIVLHTLEQIQHEIGGLRRGVDDLRESVGGLQESVGGLAPGSTRAWNVNRDR